MCYTEQRKEKIMTSKFKPFLRIDDKILHNKWKAAASLSGITMEHLTEDAMKFYLEKKLKKLFDRA